MRIGALVNEGSWYARDLERAAAELGHRFARLDFPRLAASIDEWNLSLHALADLKDFDVILVRTMPPGSLEQVVYRMDALQVLESSGTLVVNSPKAVECAVDKFLATYRMALAGLRVPATICCENTESALEAFGKLGGDVVVKPLFGAEGRGIVRVSDPDLAWRTFRTLERLNAVIYLQEYIDHVGWDIRVMVLDGEILGGMRRINDQDFRTNVARNSRIEEYRPTGQEAEWALSAAAAVGARFAGVDLLYNRAGLGYVIEVNAVPGWRAFAKATGQDVAARLLKRLGDSRREHLPLV